MYGAKPVLSLAYPPEFNDKEENGNVWHDAEQTWPEYSLADTHLLVIIHKYDRTGFFPGIW